MGLGTCLQNYDGFAAKTEFGIILDYFCKIGMILPLRQNLEYFCETEVGISQ